MRGYFLVSLIIDHLQYWPNALDWLTARGQLFVSAAEGFFFISGIVLGIVRGRKLADQPLRVASWLLIKRALQLYITYVVLALAFTLVGWLFLDNPGLKFGILPPDTPILKLIWDTLSFQYMYGWADYLRLYCMFLFISPLVIWLLRKGLWWVVLTASITGWLLGPAPTWPASTYTQPFNWQVLFFGGMVLGYHWQEVAAFWKKIPLLWQRTTIVVVVGTAAVTIAANVFLAYGGKLGPDVYNTLAPIREHLQLHYFDKENLPWQRVALFLVWFWAGFWLFSYFQKYIIKFFGWILLPFGTNSLYVYTVHAFLIFFAHLIIAPGNKNFFINILFTFSIIGVIWVMIRYKVLFKIIPR